MSLWGELNCPKCNENLYIHFFGFNINTLTLIPFNGSKVRSINRIGPHNIDILSILVGSLLGDGYCEKHGNGARICFQQEGSHSQYLLSLHNRVAQLGYCTPIIPKLSTRLALHGKVRKILRFKTFTFSSLNWIEECFYKIDPVLSYRVKIVPYCIEEYLSPLALAIWIMEDGGKVLSGIKLSTNSFTRNEVSLLCDILIKKFNLKTTIQSEGARKPSMFLSTHNKLFDQSPTPPFMGRKGLLYPLPYGGRGGVCNIYL
jgi:ubiquinol-cytochrome c reductase cytochrome b subunit